MKNQGQYLDEEIIKAVKAGGSSREKVTAYLYRQHIDEIITFIKARKGSEEEAKDVFQDALIQLLIAIEKDQFKGQSTLSTYLFAMSKNLWYRRFRRLGVEKNYLNTLTDAERRVVEVTPETRMLSKNQEQIIEELLDNLAEKCKEVLTLWSMKYSMKEIAKRLGYKNEQVVRNRKNLCMKALKQLVNEHPNLKQIIAELVE